MKIYLSQTHADEDGPLATEGKLGIIYSSKDDLMRLCDFFAEVKDYIQDNSKCHMHFRDSFECWDINNHIDIEVNLE